MQPTACSGEVQEGRDNDGSHNFVFAVHSRRKPSVCHQRLMHHSLNPSYGFPPATVLLKKQGNCLLEGHKGGNNIYLKQRVTQEGNHEPCLTKICFEPNYEVLGLS